MHLSSQTLAAAGDSPWMIPNPLQKSPNLGLALTFSSNANLTANVQYTYDDPMQTPRAVTLNRAAAVLTVTDPGHGLIVGDAVTISNPNSDASNIWGGTGPNPSGGTAGVNYDVATVVDQNNYTVAVANSGSVGPAGGAVRSYRLFLHGTLKAISGVPPTRIDGSLGLPVGALRLNVSAYTAGNVTLTAQIPAGT